jgi:ribonucleoside-diphosphate reductase subunit M2
METAACGLQMALAAHHSLMFSRSEVNSAWIDQWKTHAERLVASACVDSIMFCEVWCALKNNENAGVQRMCRDKTMFTQWTVHRYSQLPALDASCVRSIVRQAVGQMEDKKPSDRVRQYTRYMADTLLQALGVPKMYYVTTNPFSAGSVP